MSRKRANYHGYSPRIVNSREAKQTFLIVCEGEKTEPNYFREFRVPTVRIKVEGVGENPSQLVSRANELQKKEADMVKPLMDKIKASIAKVGKAKGYQYVLNLADLLLADGPDLTADVKKDLGF